MFKIELVLWPIPQILTNLVQCQGMVRENDINFKFRANLLGLQLIFRLAGDFNSDSVEISNYFSERIQFDFQFIFGQRSVDVEVFRPAPYFNRFATCVQTFF